MASLVSRAGFTLSTKRWMLGRQAVCWYTQQPPETPAKSTATTGTQTSPVPPSEPEVQDNSTYKCQEYYSYNNVSYYDIDVDMVSHRIEQPSKFPPQK